MEPFLFKANGDTAGGPNVINLSEYLHFFVGSR